MHRDGDLPSIDNHNRCFLIPVLLPQRQSSEMDRFLVSARNKVVDCSDVSSLRK